MSTYSPTQVARLLGVSADTVRRLCDEGRLASSRSTGGHRVIDGASLAGFLTNLDEAFEPQSLMRQSARNRLTGIVTRVERDTITAVVEIVAPPHRIVSLMTRDAADDLSLEVGDMATAAVKSTNVIVQLPDGP